MSVVDVLVFYGASLLLDYYNHTYTTTGDIMTLKKARIVAYSGTERMRLMSCSCLSWLVMKTLVVGSWAKRSAGRDSAHTQEEE